MKKWHVFLVMSAIILSACANSQPPSGGLPDKTPPTVLSAEPSTATLHFSGKAVRMTMNKYVNKQQFKDNFFISPAVKMDISWSGKEVEIEFKQPLDTNTTYAMTVGTGYSDLHGVKPSEAFTLIFSTGSHLDSGLIRGKLFDDNPSGAFIFLYPLDKCNPDTLNPAHTKPKYRTQVGTSGSFDFKALPKGRYRLIAVRDEFRNELFDEGVDAFGAPISDLTIDEGVKAQTELRIAPARDTIPPALFSVNSLSSRRLKANFSEKLDTNSVSPSAFLLADSTEKVPAPNILAAYVFTNEPSSAEIFLARPLDTTVHWRLTAISVRDSAGNKMNDSAKSVVFSADAGIDTTAPLLIRVPMRDSSTNVSVNTPLTFVFSTGVNKDSALAAIQFNAVSGKGFAYQSDWQGENILKLEPMKPLESSAWYIFEINLGKIRGLNGRAMKDSVQKIRFQTADIRTYGAVSGTLKDSSETEKKPYILTLISKDKSIKIKKILTKTGKWEFTDVPPGTYTLWAFCDTNENGIFDFGQPFPFKFSEKFAVVEKEITIRSRWTVEDISVTFR